MSQSFVPGLSATPPPPRTFWNAGAANAEIRRLESSLGIAASKPIHHIARANARIAELLAQKQPVLAPVAKASPPAPVQVVAPIQPAAPFEIPLPKLRSLCACVFGTEPTATRSECYKAIHFAGLNIAGVPTAAHVVCRTGISRSIQATLQSKADAFLTKNNN